MGICKLWPAVLGRQFWASFGGSPVSANLQALVGSDGGSRVYGDLQALVGSSGPRLVGGVSM